MKDVDTAQAVNAAGFTSRMDLAVCSRLYARNVMEQVRGVMTMKNKPPHPKFDVTLELTYQKSYCVESKFSRLMPWKFASYAHKANKGFKELADAFCVSKGK